jgi:hypothetical protein
VPGVARPDAIARGVQSLRAGRLQVPLEGGQGRGGRGCPLVALFAGERAAARFDDGALEPLVEIGQLARRVRLLRRKVAAFPLELQPGEKVRRAAVPR